MLLGAISPKYGLKFISGIKLHVRHKSGENEGQRTSFRLLCFKRCVLGVGGHGMDGFILKGTYNRYYTYYSFLYFAAC